MAQDLDEIFSQIGKVAESPQKVVVAMSGGVDSSTVAALLKHQGHEVIGVTLQLYDHGMALAKKGACCAGQDIYDASIAAEKIGIPHYVLNYENIFKQAVIDDFVDSYVRGQTPIPCVRCNQRVKFRDLLKVAKDLGADCLATGHYVRRIQNGGSLELHRGFEHAKDQSYFLFATTMEQLDFLRFPIGMLRKTQTRELAKYFGLEVADKADSQDICFVPNGSYAEVVKKHRPKAFEEGNIIFKDGTPIGRHQGIINYTIGQRRGLGIASEHPLYVLKIEPENNAVVVGYKEDLESHVVLINELNWLIEVRPHEVIECSVKLRSGHTPLPAAAEVLDGGRGRVALYQGYSGVAPGQACVLYDGDRLLGGGWIEGVEEK
jgi:tRNA-specific 2-thiouridylase